MTHAVGHTVVPLLLDRFCLIESVQALTYFGLTAFLEAKSSSFRGLILRKRAHQTEGDCDVSGDFCSHKCTCHAAIQLALVPMWHGESTTMRLHATGGNG